jgi:hypothetical protein
LIKVARDRIFYTDMKNGTSRQQLLTGIITDPKQPQHVQHFNYLGSTETRDATRTPGIKSRMAMAKAAFNKMKAIFTRKLDLNLKKKLVKGYISSILLYGAENWTLRELDQKYLESLNCGAAEEWRRSVGPIVGEVKKC